MNFRSICQLRLPQAQVGAMRGSSCFIVVVASRIFFQVSKPFAKTRPLARLTVLQSCFVGSCYEKDFPLCLSWALVTIALLYAKSGPLDTKSSGPSDANFSHVSSLEGISRISVIRPLLSCFGFFIMFQSNR